MIAFLLIGALHPTPKTSLAALVSSNGYGTLQYSIAEKRFDRMLQHPYKFESHNTPTRDLLHDAYFGVRHGGGHGWLPDGEVLDARYVGGTGVIAVTQRIAGATVTTYAFAPRQLAGTAFVLIAKIENLGDTTLLGASLVGLVNQRLDHSRPEPQPLGESIQYDVAKRAFIEYGGFNTSAAAAIASPLGNVTRRSSGGAGVPSNPWILLTGGQQLSDAIDDAGSAAQYNATDIALGYEWAYGELAPGEARFAGIAVSYDHGNIADDGYGRLSDWVADIGDDPEAVLVREIAAWNDVTAFALPPAMSEQEQALYRQSLAFLKMAQVQESGRAKGQLLASVAASTSDEWNQWNITWVRDMAYATTALAEAGQLAEARAALEFVLRAQVGRFTAPEFVGRPYQISMCRYFGDGSEESDDNENGPNVEYDGFGLFLWSLGRYVELSGDKALLEAYWPSIKDRVADVLVALVEPYTGLVRADSSIWETHWNGKQRQFAYTSLVGVSGLCAAGSMAKLMGDEELGRSYRNVARQMREAIVARLTDDKGVIASSLEERNTGKNYYDAAVIEAVAMGLFDPKGREATATIDAIFEKLSVGSGRGLFRNDEGGDYDNQEWVFVNLRAVVALLLAGDQTRAAGVYDWVVAQSGANSEVIAELYNRAVEGEAAHTYAGSVPMVGFGAGAYILAANAKYALVTPALPCGGYANQLETTFSAPVEEMKPGEGDPSKPEEKKGCSASGTTILPFAFLLLRARRRAK